MDDLESKLNSLLSSPEDMAKIMNLAKSLSGGDSASAPPETASEGPSQEETAPDPGLLSAVTKLFREYKTSGHEKTALAEALSPYLEPDRREALQKAVKIAKLAHLVKVFWKDSGGDFHI